MGKKFKSGTKQSPPGGQGKVATNETTGHMGISKKSKKIKKQKNREDLTDLTKLKDGALGTEAIVEHAVMKEKKKNKKHKTLPVDENSAVRKPGVEVNGNGSEAVGSKKSKKDKLKAPEVKSDNNEQEPKKKHKKKKVSVEDEPEASAGGTGSDVFLKKSQKKKRKALEIETKVNDDKPKKHKKNKASVTDKPDDTAEENGTEVAVSKKEKRNAPVLKTEVHGDKPQKKHKKKNKLKNQLNGAKAESKTSVKEPKIKVKPNKQQVKAIEADKDVVTSESESEDEQNDTSNDMDKVNQSILNQHSKADGDDSSGDEQTDKKAKDKKVDEEKKKKHFTGPEHSIFIGNLPNTVKKAAMKSMFKQYGQIQSIRFRSNDGVTLFKKKDRKEAKALNCYIRFETRKEAEAACAANGQLVEGNRIRVTMHMQKQMGHAASTVFVGNINHKTTDNELYDFFSRVGEIEYVRQIADKGIGYVCFKKGVSIAKALKLNQQLLNGRPLRIVKVDPTKQGKRKNKKGNLVDKAKFSRPGGPASQTANGGQKPKAPAREFHGAIAKTKSDNKHKQKKKKGGSDMKKKLLAQKLTAAGASRKK